MQSVQTTIDLGDIKQNFKQVIAHAHGINSPKVETLFEQWLEGKKDFISAFGGLTYETKEEVEIKMTSAQKDDTLDTLFGYYTIKEALGEDGINFLKLQGHSVFENKISVASEKYPEVKVGMKLSKSIKHIIKKETFIDSVQALISRAIQNQSIKGIICVSVHPLDFLSVSDNCHKWTSCHALDSDMCCGNLEYMVDKSTFIAYIKAPEDMLISNFGDVKWNSKKWRALCHMSDEKNRIVMNKQYPSYQTGIESFFNRFFVEIFKNNSFAVWASSNNISNLAYNSEKFYTDLEFSNVGFDFGLRSERVNIGATAPCLKCGEKPLFFNHIALCKECGNGFICNCCDNICSGPQHMTLDGIVCSSCYEHDYVACSQCGDMIYHDNVYRYHGGYYCSHCHTQISIKARRDSEGQMFEKE